MLKHIFTILFLLLFTLCLQGCQNKIANPITETKREITDDLGRKILLPLKVERAISLAPNLTEIAFAVDAGDKLIGVTSFCNYPEQTKNIQKIGDTMNPNLENIIALKPQIVFVSTASQMENFAKTLESQQVAVFVTNPNNLDGIYKTIYQFGEIFDKKEKANQVIDDLKKRVANVEAKTKNVSDVKTFVQISREPLFTVGKDSFLNDLILRGGGVSVTADIATAYPKLSKETALALSPEAIILSESPDNLEPNELFKNSNAVKNSKVFKINADILSRPSPRVVDALEQIAKALHSKEFE